jgi:hypothetical protein
MYSICAAYMDGPTMSLLAGDVLSEVLYAA